MKTQNSSINRATIQYRKIDRPKKDEYPVYSQHYFGLIKNERSLDTIFEEYWSVRLATLLLFQNLPEESLPRRGSGIDVDGTLYKRSVRALAYHISGHELNHVKVIKERYLGIEVGKFPF